MTDDARSYWDDQARDFDAEPDHGLRDPTTRAAWRALLVTHLPAWPADVVDLGCGTGSLSVLLAQEGHRVTGIDLAENMLDAARVKAEAAGVDVSFERGDAGSPALSPGSADVVLVRHLLWAMPDQDAAIATWVRLLRPGGRLLLVEGRWSTGGGVPARRCAALVRAHRSQAVVHELADPVLWGRPIQDERYLLVSTA